MLRNIITWYFGRLWVGKYDVLCRKRTACELTVRWGNPLELTNECVFCVCPRLHETTISWFQCDDTHKKSREKRENRSQATLFVRKEHTNTVVIAMRKSLVVLPLWTNRKKCRVASNYEPLRLIILELQFVILIIGVTVTKSGWRMLKAYTIRLI